jgi:uncharacterized protein YfaQ (DUF2300 family)
MSAQAFTLIAGGDAGWLSDDVPSILGRPARSCQQFADYARRLVLRRDPAPVDSKCDAVDEAGIITCEEDDRRSKFLGLSYATCWC